MAWSFMSAYQEQRCGATMFLWNYIEYSLSLTFSLYYSCTRMFMEEIRVTPA